MESGRRELRTADIGKNFPPPHEVGSAVHGLHRRPRPGRVGRDDAWVCDCYFDILVLLGKVRDFPCNLGLQNGDR